MRSRLNPPLYRPASILLLPLLAVGLSPAVAAADEPDALTDQERPATWDMSVEELQEIGLGQYRGDPVPVPDWYPHNGDPDIVSFAPTTNGGVTFLESVLGD